MPSEGRDKHLQGCACGPFESPQRSAGSEGKWLNRAIPSTSHNRRFAAPRIFATRQPFRLWHLANMLGCRRLGRFRRCSGLVMLDPSLSARDPTRTSAGLKFRGCSGFLAQLVCYSLKHSYPGVAENGGLRLEGTSKKQPTNLLEPLARSSSSRPVSA